MRRPNTLFLALSLASCAAQAVAASDGGRPRGVAPDCKYMDASPGQASSWDNDGKLTVKINQSPSITRTRRHLPAYPILRSRSHSRPSTTIIAIVLTEVMNPGHRLAPTFRNLPVPLYPILGARMPTGRLPCQDSTAITKATSRRIFHSNVSMTEFATTTSAAMEATNGHTLVA